MSKLDWLIATNLTNFVCKLQGWAQISQPQFDRAVGLSERVRRYEEGQRLQVTSDGRDPGEPGHVHAEPGGTGPCPRQTWENRALMKTNLGEQARVHVEPKATGPIKPEGTKPSSRQTWQAEPNIRQTWRSIPGRAKHGRTGQFSCTADPDIIELHENLHRFRPSMTAHRKTFPNFYRITKVHQSSMLYFESVNPFHLYNEF